MLNIEQDDGAQEKKSNGNAAAASKRQQARTSGAATTKTRLRQKDRAADEQVEARKQHQKELHDKKNMEGLERFQAMAGDSLVEEKQWKRFESYAREVQLPDSVKSQQVRRQSFRSSQLSTPLMLYQFLPIRLLSITAGKV